MKKISLLLAALLVLTVALCACGSDTTSSASSEAGSAVSSEVSSEASSEASSEVSSEAASEVSSEASTSETAAGDYGDFETVEEGKLIMSTNAQFPPYELVSDGEGFNGTGFEGIDVEIASAIADKLGLELTDRRHGLRLRPGGRAERLLRRGAGRPVLLRGAGRDPGLHRQLRHRRAGGHRERGL